jgi:hypothetical protein
VNKIYKIYKIYKAYNSLTACSRVLLEKPVVQWFPKWAGPPPGGGGGGGITEVGATRYERWKGALLLSQGGASRQVVLLIL